MTPAAKQARFDALRAIGCVCCHLNRQLGLPRVIAAFGAVEIHHLNGGGHHGQKRRGDDFTIPLCLWHHRGQGPAREMRDLYGPSWAKGSKPFRAVYGSDDELLALTNDLLETP